MIKPASQMASAPTNVPILLIDALITRPEFVPGLVDCAPALTDEEPGNAGLVILGVVFSPEEAAKAVDDGGELVSDAEADAGNYKKNKPSNNQLHPRRLTLFVELAGPSTDAAFSQKLYAGMFVSAAGVAKQEVLNTYSQVYSSDSSSG